MAERLPEKNLVTFEELLIANSIQTDALCQLLIEKGLITEQEFFGKLKQVQAEYQEKKGQPNKREPDFTTIFTLGTAGQRTQFRYDGNVESGVTLDFKGKPRISAEFFRAVLTRFSGQTIAGGFSMTHPKPGGLGDWVQKNSLGLNPVHLTPRHASFIAAVLEHEDYISSFLDGNTVFLHFKRQ